MENLNNKKLLKVKYKKLSFSKFNYDIFIFILLYIISFILFGLSYVFYKYIIIERNKYLNKFYISIDYLKYIQNNLTFINNKNNLINNELKNLNLVLDKFIINNSYYLEKYNKIKQINKNLKGKNSYIQMESYSNIFKYNDFIKITYYLKDILITNNQFNKTEEYYPAFNLKYKATNDKCTSNTFISNILGKNDILIAIKTTENKIFGVFYHNKIISDYNKKKNLNIDYFNFLFNLNLNDYFPIKKNENLYWFNEYMTFNIGLEDIFIADDCLNNSFSLCKFPYSFNITQNNLNKYINYNKTKFKHINEYLNFLFCGIKNSFKVEEIEIYKIDINI